MCPHFTVLFQLAGNGSMADGSKHSQQHVNTLSFAWRLTLILKKQVSMFLSITVHLRCKDKHRCLCGASVPAKHVHLYVLLLVGRAVRRAWPPPGRGLRCASVPAAKHVHLYVLLLIGWDAAHSRHQAEVAVPQYRPSMFICMCCCW
jgi:hypothetical protein